MKRFIIIVIAILVFDIIVTTGYFWYNQNKLSEMNQVKESSVPEVEEGDQGKDESKVEEARNNALSEVVETNENGDALIINKVDYQIIYQKEFDQFLISILKSPFEEIRKSAEQEFLGITKADKETVCQLNVIVTTPYFANPDLAGKIFSLSFCQTSN